MTKKNMLPRFNRLPSSEIPNAMRQGKRFSNGDIVLIIRRNADSRVKPENDKASNRFSFVVSTKIDKRATRRNRMKRLLSESVTHLTSRLHGPADYIFIVKKDFSGMPQSEVESVVAGLLKV